MSWTDERVQMLSKLWLEGRSASQIATELGMGVTRNAVIGKVHRLGLAGRPKAAVPTAAPARKAVKPAARAHEPVFAEPVFESAPPLPVTLKPIVSAPALADFEAPVCEQVTIMELRESSCRWPMGDPTSADFRYCGARTPVGSCGPYCSAHARLAFQPAPERRRDRVDRFARIA
jgi:GcrA cell cycle regulator